MFIAVQFYFKLKKVIFWYLPSEGKYINFLNTFLIKL